MITENANYEKLKTPLKVEIFENAVFVFSCGHLKTELFVNDDVVRSNSKTIVLEKFRFL